MTVLRALVAGFGGGVVFGMVYGAAIFILAGLFGGEGGAGLVGIFIGVPYGAVFGGMLGLGLGVIAAVLFGVAALFWRESDPEVVRPLARALGALVPLVGVVTAVTLGRYQALDLDSWFFLLPILLAMPVVMWLAPWIAGLERFPKLRFLSMPHSSGEPLMPNGWRP